ncbi:hypothetical protein JDV02_004625 [Purpureocillium takamizusanense]|uniref:C2H2-type domain-containing protein n=1 Tax=Purpureocillium takamizusanense TaxID=2060973 RepID=A0A9Q8QGR7_9HYPO|nr:uncharacterized protein JDV02_004625 [Purpureocillium takamizusanense]UNI18352.1 hypothetical protein JDV02_004625 [Purpureocillium takamizusanense]
MAFCSVCDRYFRTESAYYQHTRASTAHMFDCHRCLRHFTSFGARRQHVRDSMHHHVCYTCDDEPDFPTAEGLHTHESVAHNECAICHRRFDTPSNLRSHRVVHWDDNVECFRCYRTFVTNSAMVLHLETGTCPSGATQGSVTSAALRGYQSAAYTRSYYRAYDDDADFQCPDCAKPCRFASALLQHAESGCCDVSLDEDSPLWDCLEEIKCSA